MAMTLSLLEDDRGVPLLADEGYSSVVSLRLQLLGHDLEAGPGLTEPVLRGDPVRSLVCAFTECFGCPKIRPMRWVERSRSC